MTKLNRAVRPALTTALTTVVASSLLSIYTPALISPAHAAPAQPAPAAEPIDVPAQLTWGIRTSFNNYVGGPTIVGDGAQWTNNAFTFPLEKSTWDEAEQRLEADYQGIVRYRSYCDGAPATDVEAQCALDLSMKNPTVVLDDDGSYIEAKVKSLQYPQGGEYAPAGPVRIANLSTDGAQSVQTAEGWSWSNVTATLTEEGNSMFSNLYEPGSALDPVSFTFTGDGPQAKELQPGDLVTAQRWESPARYDDLHRVYTGPVLDGDDQPSVVVTAAGNGAYLLDSNLQQKAKLEESFAPYGATHFNPKTNDLVYALSEGKEVYASHVTSEGFESRRLLADVKGTAVAISSTSAGDVVVLSHDFGQSHPHAAFMTVISPSGDVRTMELPDTAELVGAELSPYSDTLYGPTYFSRNQLTMMPLSDGTFVFDPKASLSLADGSEKKGILLHINPAATQGVEAVSVLEGTEFTEQPASIDTISVNDAGTRIVRYNKFSGAHSRAQVLDYANGRVQALSEPGQIPGLSDLASVSFDGEQPVFYDANQGTLNWVEPADNAVTKSFQVPNGFKTQGKLHGQFLVRDDALFVPTLVADRGDWEDYYFLQKIDIVQEADGNVPPVVEPPVEEPSATGSSFSWGTALAAIAGIGGIVALALAFMQHLGLLRF